MEKYKIIVLFVIGISTLIVLCNFSLCTSTIGFLASTKEYLALEIADRGYSNNYNGAGGQIITIDISGNSSSNNNSSLDNKPSTTTPVQNTSTDATPSNSENNINNNSNNNNNNSSNNSVSFGSSTSSSTVSPINTPSDSNNNDDSSNVSDDILSNVSSSAEIGKILEFSSSMAIVKVKSDNDINQTLNLRANKLLLGYSLQKQLGGENEYFELYLSKGINEKVEFSGKEFDLSIKIDPEKEFLGFYEVVDDTSLKIINYNKTDINTINLQTSNLGRYIICYKESEVSNEVENNNNSLQNTPYFEETNNNNGNNNFIWIILAITLCSVVIFAIAAIVIFKKFVL